MHCFMNIYAVFYFFLVGGDTIAKKMRETHFFLTMCPQCPHFNDLLPFDWLMSNLC